MKSLSGYIVRTVRQGKQTVAHRATRVAQRALHTVVGEAAGAQSKPAATTTKDVSKKAQPSPTYAQHVVAGSNIAPDATALLTELRKLYDEKNYEAVVDKFFQLDTHGVVPNKYAYLWVLESLASLGRYRTCVETFEKMVVRQVQVMASHYTAVIKSLAWNGDVDTMMHLLDQFNNHGLTLQNLTLEAALAVAATAADVTTAKLLLEMLPPKDRSVGMYGNAIRAAIASHSADEAFKLWKSGGEILRGHHGRDVMLTGTTLDVLAACINHDHADGILSLLDYLPARFGERVLDEGTILRSMESLARITPPRFLTIEGLWKRFSAHLQIKPPQEAFSMVLMAYANGRLVSRAFEFLSTELANGYQLHPFVAESLATAIGEPVDRSENVEERLDKAYDTLKTMQEKGSKISIECVNIVVLACSRAGDLSRAVHFANETETFDLKPNTGTLNAMLVGAANLGSIQAANDFIERMTTLDVALDARSHELILQTYVSARDFTGAVTKLKNNISEGIKLPWQAYFHTVRGLVSVSDLGSAMEVVDLLKDFPLYHSRLLDVISGAEANRIATEEAQQIAAARAATKKPSAKAYESRQGREQRPKGKYPPRQRQ